MINDLTRNAGQMLVVGFDGTSLPRSVASALSDGHIGGTILFARNIIEPEQVADLNHQIYKAAGDGLLPFVSVDQEGGRVQRLKEPLTRIPPMLEVGKTGNPRLAMRIGKVLGSELEALGFNLDYAPDAAPARYAIELRGVGAPELTPPENPDLAELFGGPPRVIPSRG